MKTIKFFFLVLPLVLPCILNAQTVWVDSIQYKLIPKGNVAEVTNCSIQSEKVILPSTISYDGVNYNVVTIASGAFKYKSYKSIVLPEDITEIGGEAFLSCPIVSINIPNKVKIIRPNAFSNCRQLESVSLGEGLEYIGDRAFKDCISLSTIVFPEELRTIDLEAFKGCSSLRNVTIGKGLETINAKAFSWTSIDTVRISDLDSWCKIQYNDSYEEYISNPLTGACLYLNNEKVTNLVIPGSVKAISKHAFRGCKDLNSVVVQYGVNEIGEGAFKGCKSLSEIKLPSTLTKVVKIFGGCDNLTNIVIPEGVKEVDDFYDNPYLTSITLPNSLQNIGGFKKCTGLRMLLLPQNLNIISNHAFEECTSLLSITIPGNVSEVGEYAFRGCTSLETLTIESGVGKVEYYAFSNCENLINIDLDAEWYSNMTFDNCNKIKTVYLGNKTKRLEGICKNCENIEDVFLYATEIPEAGDDFSGSYIQYITLHVPAVSISKFKQASWPWNQFKEIAEITGIDKYSEIEVEGIKYYTTSYTECEVAQKQDHYSGDIVIPETVSINNKEYKVTSIGKRAFLCCSSLKSIELPNSIIEIGEDAFNQSGIESIKLPHNLRKIGPGSFSWSKLKKIVIPEMVERICAHTFRDCCYLDTVIIPNKVTSIGDGAFNGCNLKTVVIGENVNSIGKAAFEQHGSLMNIYTLNRTPPVLNVEDNDYHTIFVSDEKFSFNDYLYKSTLWVPESSLEEYKKYKYYNWGKFENIQTFDPNTFDLTTLGIKTTTNDEEEVNRYSLDGRKLLAPTKGVNIIKMKDGTVKKVFVK